MMKYFNYFLIAVFLFFLMIMAGTHPPVDTATVVNTLVPEPSTTSVTKPVVVAKPKPVAKPKDPNIPDITAESAFAVLRYADGTEKIIYALNPDRVHPIASLSKLASASTVVDNIPEQAIITISSSSVAYQERAGQLLVGETYYRDELLYPLLIESSNDAAVAFADYMDSGRFLEEMNVFALNAGATSTTFSNPSGLDIPPVNLSTARDVSRIVYYIYKHHPELLKITTLSTHVFVTNMGVRKELHSTDVLLDDPTVPFAIIGGKTGTTLLAKEALTLITTGPTSDTQLIFVILRSDDRETDMKRLMEWTAKHL